MAKIISSPQLAKAQQEPVDVLGIAGILPLDHTFWLGDSEGISRAVEEFRSIQVLQGGPPPVSFPFESYRRSGGGRIANVLAWLGPAGQRVGVCGSVGDDEAGHIVLEDLRKNRVDVSNVLVCTRRHTRLVFLAATSRAPAVQAHLKQRPLSTFSSKIWKDLPESQILVVGRANQAVLRHIHKLKEDRTTKVAFHLSSWPWRRAEHEMHVELLRNSDIVVADERTAHVLKRSLGMSADASPEELAHKSSARLFVVYGGVNQVTAVLSRPRSTVRPDDCKGFNVIEPTGMMESFHGALLSFSLRHRDALTHTQFARAALGYANEVAAISGRGVGPRHLASLREQELLQQTYLRASGLFQYDVAISFAGEDRLVALEIADKLAKMGLSVFYDQYQQADLWGKDLFTHLQDVYRKQSRFCLMLISKAYRGKQWTSHERRAAQARAFEDSSEYILPARLDDADLPGLLPTDGYIDLRKITIDRLVELIRDKVRAQ
jgi:sugar/nucleoside kinase (ribokinase family)